MQKPQSIHSILEKTLKSLDIDVPLRTYAIWRAWKEIVGETVAGQTQPRAVRNRILFVDVSHSTWVQQLQFLKSTLLEKINAFLGGPSIEDIRFKLGKISPTWPAHSGSDVRREEDLDGTTLKRIEALVEKIDDEEAKRVLCDVLKKSAKLERYRKKLK